MSTLKSLGNFRDLPGENERPEIALQPAPVFHHNERNFASES
jgi:hypothetical protein